MECQSTSMQLTHHREQARSHTKRPRHRLNLQVLK
jgi:hypothetical protein